MRRYDLAVVGGGTAGLIAALVAAGAGARVCLVERARVGGECLWTGCVPSKSLLAAADLAQRMRGADRVGLVPVEPKVDFQQVIEHVRAAQARIAPHDSPERLRAAGIDVLQGHARFAGSGRLLVDAGDSSLQVRWRAALIATGSQPVLPELPGLQQADPLTSDTVWDLEELPERLLVIGGGPVGCELAQGFARLGTRVTLLEAEAALLPGEEPEAGALLAERLHGEGVDPRPGSRGLRVERDGGGFALDAGSDGWVGFDRVLVATGRRAVTDGLGLDTLGVRVGPAGNVLVDRRLRTSTPGVFAAGDVTGVLPFTHVAAQARLAAPNALFGLRRHADYRAVPRVVFTDPEVAHVGLSEAAARERFGARVTSWSFPYERLDRAVTAGQGDGFAKLVGGPRGRLVGATVAAPAAGEAIAELAQWVARGARISEVSQAVHAYPTFAEGPARAADQAVRARWQRPAARWLTRAVLVA
ncbi:MAG TPA: FAD-dependent oxidoreductase, partial [Actinomycetes bacterium]|nr:FAD-dependent oxidoreductase [Actinomycetes bacterium]